MGLLNNNYQFNSFGVALAPSSHGVYRLYAGAELIYIGRASGIDVTIQSRLRSHLSGREGPCTQSATSFDYIESTVPAYLEAELLERYRSLYGRLPRCNARVG